MRETLAPANRLDRQERREAFWQSRKKKFFLIIVILAILLQILFLGNMSYLYGSLWKSPSRFHNFEILYVDYDEAVVGKAVWQAYERLQGPGFPTLVQRNKTEYTSIDEVVGDVKNTKYWAALTTNRNASHELSLALQGGDSAQRYDATNAITYIWNEVRYPPFSLEIFVTSFQTLIASTRLVYNEENGNAALGMLNKGDPVALQVLLNPISASEINLMPTPQQTKLLYNTASTVIPILQQLFFLLILNGVSQELQLYSKLPLHISGLLRIALTVTYDMVASLLMTTYIWAFREDWGVNANQFVLTWMVLWLLMHIHLLVIDSCTAVMPLPALPFFLVTWIILSVTSTISPLQANPSFYKWSYALPANEAYTVLTDIWSSGNVPQLHRALPVLFSWWMVGLIMATYGHFYRCHKAWKQDEKLERLIRPELKQEKQSYSSGSNLQGLHLTPSEALLQAADGYRSVYGPSIPPPVGLWKAFVSPDNEHADPLNDGNLDLKSQKTSDATEPAEIEPRQISHEQP